MHVTMIFRSVVPISKSFSAEEQDLTLCDGITTAGAAVLGLPQAGPYRSRRTKLTNSTF